MRRIIYLGVATMVLATIGFISCEKEELTNNQELVESTNSSKDSDAFDEKAALADGIVILRCDQKRKKFDCLDGWGLCNCVWFPDAPWKQIQTQIDDQNNTMTMVSESFRDNGFDTLTIDEDFTLPADFSLESGYNSVIIKEGRYVKDQNSEVIVNVELN